MTTAFERDRAKRAKLKARYESIKQKSASGVGKKYSPMPTSPTTNPVEVDDNRDDEPLSAAIVSASESESRDTSPTESNEAPMEEPHKSQAPSYTAAQQRASQVAMAKKKLAASRKAVSPMKTAYTYKPIVEAEKVAVPEPTPPIEEKPNEPYTPPRGSKKVEMARKLAASRRATSPQPKAVQHSGPGEKNSIKAKRNAFAHKSQTIPDVGSVSESKSSSFERTDIMDRFAKTAGTRSNELARLRAASPALAAAVKPSSQPKPEHGESFEHCESDDDESTFYGDYSAKDAVFQRREQYWKKQEENSNKHTSNIVLDPPPLSVREQFLKKQEDKLKTKAVYDSFPIQPRSNDIVPPPPPPPPPLPYNIESEKASQEFGDGFGFSQEEFSNASWGLGPAFSADMKANGDADWSNPVNCSSEQKGSKSAEWTASFDSKTSKDKGEDGVESEGKEHIEQTAVSPSATASVQYMDFGVGKSGGGSVDCDSIIDEEEERNNSFVSEETTASATEFDPLSMFGGSEDYLSQEVEQAHASDQSRGSGAHPANSKKEEMADNRSSDHVQSVYSSQKLTKDEPNSISFHSLNSGDLMKPPQFAHQLAANNSTRVPPPPPVKNVLKAPPDSPSGTESLESWWQSRYASSQNNDINAAVQEALLNGASSVSKKSQADSSKNTSGASTISTRLTPVRSNERVASREINEEDSCSVFSGISGIEDSKKKYSRHQGAMKKKAARSISLAESEDEDIFSGVSASNTTDHQADDTAMNSSSGFTLKRTNAESQSMLYGNNTIGMTQYADKKVMKSLADGMSTVSFSTPIQTTNAASQYMREPKESLSSLPETNYGVIELKNNEKSSPTNSQTSDITSSVVFGFDPPKRAAHQRRGRMQERILETSESDEADSVISKEVSVNDKVGKLGEGDLNTKANGNRGVSLVAPSTTDSTSQGSSFDDIQYDESEDFPTFVSSLRHQAKSAIMSRFSCGLLNASSFACAPVLNLASKSGCTMRTESSSLDDASTDSIKLIDSNKSGGTKSESHDDESNAGKSRQSIEMPPPKEETAAAMPPTLSPHQIRLRESSFGKGGVEVMSQGVEVMSQAAARTISSVGTQKELPVYKSASEAQKEAYEALLLYAYTALSVPAPKISSEKGEGAASNPIIYPSIDGGVKEMGIMMERFRREGIAVLKLNKHNQWQPRFLTVTKEVNKFKKADDDKYAQNAIDSCPKGLLWLKKFNDSEQSVASMKKGKGGVFFSTIESVSVSSKSYPLSKKQQKGAFKDSYTFVVVSNDNGSKREIHFRLANKDDAILLSAGFQAVIDRVKNDDENLKPKSFKLKVDVNAVTGRSSPLSPAGPFSGSRRAVANPISDNRWEV